MREFSDTAPAGSVSRPFQILLLILVVVAVYAPSLRNGFSLDDGPVLQNDPRLRSWEGFPLLFRSVPAKPQLPWARLVRKLSLFVDARIWGEEALGFHVGNLVYHILAVGVFYGYVHKLSGRSDIAWMASFLFAIHPAVSTSVDSIANRKEILAFLASCLSLYLWEKRSHPVFWILSLLAYVLALLSKETSAAVCLILLYRTNRFGQRGWIQRIPGTLALCFPHLLLGAGWLFHIHRIMAGPAGWNEGVAAFNPQTAPGYPFFVVLRSLPVSWWMYLRQSFLPFNPLFTQNPAWFTEPSRGVLGLACTASCVMLFLFWRHRPGSGARMGLLWYVAFLLPALNLVPHTYFFAERYLYGSVAGLAWTVACWLTSHGNRRVSWMMVLFLGSGLGWGTWNRHALWRSHLTYWQEAYHRCPESVEGMLGLGSALAEEGRWSEAEILLNKGLASHAWTASSCSALHNLACAVMWRGDRKGAGEIWEQALSLDPWHVPGRLAYARWLALEKRDQEAILCLEGTLEGLEQGYAPLQPFGLGSVEAAECHHQLGTLLARAGDMEKGRAHYERAVGLDRSRADSWLALGWLLENEPFSDVSRAREAYKMALNLGAPAGACFMGLARMAEVQGDVKAAVRWYETAASSSDLSPYFRESCQKKAARLAETLR